MFKIGDVVLINQEKYVIVSNQRFSSDVEIFDVIFNYDYDLCPLEYFLEKIKQGVSNLGDLSSIFIRISRYRSDGKLARGSESDIPVICEDENPFKFTITADRYNR
jgi:hypothetical protein